MIGKEHLSKKSRASKHLAEALESNLPSGWKLQIFPGGEKGSFMARAMRSEKPSWINWHGYKQLIPEGLKFIGGDFFRVSDSFKMPSIKRKSK